MYFRMLLCALLSCVCLSLDVAAVVAQSPPETTVDEKKLEALLDEVGVLYRKRFSEEGQFWEYAVAIEGGDQASMVKINLKQWGTRGDGTKVYTVYGWTVVTELATDQPIPPEVIKYVASTNDKLMIGNYSIGGNKVYANMGVIMQDLTASSLGMYLMNLHANCVTAKKEIDALANVQYR